MRKKLTTYIEKDLIKRIKIKAIEGGKYVADILNELLEEYLDNSQDWAKACLIDNNYHLIIIAFLRDIKKRSFASHDHGTSIYKNKNYMLLEE